MPTIREKLQATVTDDQLLTIHEWNQVAPEILDQWESGGQEALSQFLKEAAKDLSWTIAPAILRLLQEKKVDPEGSVTTIQKRQEGAEEVYRLLLAKTVDDNNFSREDLQGLAGALNVYNKGSRLRGMVFLLDTMRSSGGKYHLDLWIRNSLEKGEAARRAVAPSLLASIPDILPEIEPLPGTVVPPPEAPPTPPAGPSPPPPVLPEPPRDYRAPFGKMGIQIIEVGKRQFSNEELQAAHKIIARLKEADRKLLKQLVRRPRPVRQENGFVAHTFANFIGENGETRIEIYDKLYTVNRPKIRAEAKEHPMIERFKDYLWHEVGHLLTYRRLLAYQDLYGPLLRGGGPERALLASSPLGQWGEMAGWETRLSTRENPAPDITGPGHDQLTILRLMNRAFVSAPLLETVSKEFREITDSNLRMARVWSQKKHGFCTDEYSCKGHPAESLAEAISLRFRDPKAFEERKKEGGVVQQQLEFVEREFFSDGPAQYQVWGQFLDASGNPFEGKVEVGRVSIPIEKEGWLKPTAISEGDYDLLVNGRKIDRLSARQHLWLGYRFDKEQAVGLLKKRFGISVAEERDRPFEPELLWSAIEILQSLPPEQAHLVKKLVRREKCPSGKCGFASTNAESGEIEIYDDITNDTFYAEHFPDFPTTNIVERFQESSPMRSVISSFMPGHTPSLND
ncbi:MAG: hypothetical protein HYS22_06070 [Deltaproteobacteria bacterium]|nr:hypothetical protein [Deltaproteobacteria bacterium]